MRLVSWNVGRRVPWADIAEVDADIALLQEAAVPPEDCPVEVLPASRDSWATAGWTRNWRTAIARVSDRVQLVERETGSFESAEVLPVSRAGTLAVADVLVDGTTKFTAVSMYAPWESPSGRDRPIYADASAHRLLSDISALVTSPKQHSVIAAGDLNILYGYGEHGDDYWRERYAGVFERAESMGLCFVGPQHGDGHSRQADPWPAELPAESKNVPTYHTNAQRPAGATRQLDFVFASAPLVGYVQTHARNQAEAWGPSDHCAIVIDLDL